MGATLRLAAAGFRRRSRVQLLALVLVCSLAATAVVAGLAAQTSSADLVDEAYETAGRPDLVLYGPPDALAEVADDPAVDAGGTPLPTAQAETDVDNQTVEVSLIGYDGVEPLAVGEPDLVEGRWPEADDETVVERSLLSEGVVELGGTFTISTDDGPRDLTVVGAAIDLTDCFWPTCDPLRTFVRPDTVDGDHALAAYRLHDPDEAGAVAGRLLDDDALGLSGANSWPDTRGDILVIGTVFGTLVGGFGTILLAAAAFVVAGATTARLVARRRTLGLLRAVGFRPRQLQGAVWLEHLVVGAASVLIGWLLGTYLSPTFQARLDEVLPGAATRFDPVSLAVAAALVLGLLTVSVAIPAVRATRQPATEVLREAPPTPTGGRRIAAVARRLGAGASTVCGLRRAFARPGRAALAGGALLVATVGSVVAFGFLGTLGDIEADPAVTGNPWDIAVVAGTAEPGDVDRTLDGTPGVDRWYTEREQTGTVDATGFTVRLIGGDVDDTGYVVQEGRPMAADDEAIVGYGFLEATGLGVGDPLTVDLEGHVVEATIVGWYSDTADTGKMIQLRESAVPAAALTDDLTWRVVAADGVDVDELAADLERRFDGTAVAMPLEVDDLGPARAAMVAMAVLLAVIALANLLATTVSGTRERARAIGVLRTVGCSTGQLVGQSAVGVAVVGLLAGLVGLPLGWLVYETLVDGLTSGIGIGPGFASAPPLVAVVLLVPAMALLSAGAGALAALGLARRPASDLVRYE